MAYIAVQAPEPDPPAILSSSQDWLTWHQELRACLIKIRLWDQLMGRVPYPAGFPDMLNLWHENQARLWQILTSNLGQEQTSFANNHCQAIGSPQVLFEQLREKWGKAKLWDLDHLAYAITRPHSTNPKDTDEYYRNFIDAQAKLEAYGAGLPAWLLMTQFVNGFRAFAPWQYRIRQKYKNIFMNEKGSLEVPTIEELYLDFMVNTEQDREQWQRQYEGREEKREARKAEVQRDTKIHRVARVEETTDPRVLEQACTPGEAPTYEMASIQDQQDQSSAPVFQALLVRDECHQNQQKHKGTSDSQNAEKDVKDVSTNNKKQNDLSQKDQKSEKNTFNSAQQSKESAMGQDSQEGNSQTKISSISIPQSVSNSTPTSIKNKAAAVDNTEETNSLSQKAESQTGELTGCEGCGIVGRLCNHSTETCFWTHPELRPEFWIKNHGCDETIIQKTRMKILTSNRVRYAEFWASAGKSDEFDRFVSNSHMPGGPGLDTERQHEYNDRTCFVENYAPVSVMQAPYGISAAVAQPLPAGYYSYYQNPANTYPFASSPQVCTGNPAEDQAIPTGYTPQNFHDPIKMNQPAHSAAGPAANSIVFLNDRQRLADVSGPAVSGPSAPNVGSTIQSGKHKAKWWAERHKAMRVAKKAAAARAADAARSAGSNGGSDSSSSTEIVTSRPPLRNTSLRDVTPIMPQPGQMGPPPPPPPFILDPVPGICVSHNGPVHAYADQSSAYIRNTVADIIENLKSEGNTGPSMVKKGEKGE